MSLTEAIDKLLAYVNEHSELIHCGEEYKEFLRLDSCVYIATHRAKLLDTLPESESENDDIGKTHLPVIWMLAGAIPRTFTWEEDMLTLRTLAENTPESEQAGKEQYVGRIIQAVGDDNAVEIITIANRKNWSGERKMQEILRLDNRYQAKGSNDWAALLGVSAAAVRGYFTWKTIQKSLKSSD